MQVKYINPFIKSSVNLFKGYLGLNIAADKPFLRTDPQDLEEVSGIIGLAGETTGAVVLSFSRGTAINIISLFARHKYNALTNEVIDGVGELVNIIAGNAKGELEQYRIEISLPGVITGKSYSIHWPEGTPVVAIPFRSNVGNFSVNVSLRDF